MKGVIFVIFEEEPVCYQKLSKEASKIFNLGVVQVWMMPLEQKFGGMFVGTQCFLICSALSRTKMFDLCVCVCGGGVAILKLSFISQCTV